MPIDLSSQLALITGATGGCGKATCFALAELKCNIAVHYRSSAAEASDLVSKLRSMGVGAESFRADVSNFSDVRRLHSEVVAKMGDPTILFNNAGTASGKSGVRSIHDVSVEDFENTWRSNTGSQFLLTQLCMPAMERARHGRVIFNSSVAAFTGGGVGPHYASSKSALHGLIHWLSANYCAQGITFNGMAPALISGTKMLGGRELEDLRKKIPMGRMGKPDEVAETVVWMVKTGYVTNKIVGVDGGIYAHG